MGKLNKPDDDHVNAPPPVFAVGASQIGFPAGFFAKGVRVYHIYPQGNPVILRPGWFCAID